MPSGSRGKACATKKGAAGGEFLRQPLVGATAARLPGCREATAPALRFAQPARASRSARSRAQPLAFGWHTPNRFSCQPKDLRSQVLMPLVHDSPPTENSAVMSGMAIGIVVSGCRLAL